MGMLVELATVSVRGAENTDFHALFADPPEYDASGGTEQDIE